MQLRSDFDFDDGVLNSFKLQFSLNWLQFPWTEIILTESQGEVYDNHPVYWIFFA